jgi:hypothetical protein
MACLFHIFTAEELKDLNERQLLLLDEAIIHELQTSKEIRDLIRSKLKGTGRGNLYTQMTAKR